ncbi:MAG: DUF1499 domain-containing protein [Euryarchaeota archaeon]|jgi:hypothetical protein|nr:DUF1499 domain-containing protein [Euryarchaeota archaeon]MBT7245263.1 DUF1499 domain-containing protein [Euryarchaeota archaeon]
MAVGYAGDSLSKSWQWAPAIYLAGLLLMNILSTPFGVSEMPDECPEGSMNCDYRTIQLDVSDEELDDAIMEWARERSFTTTFTPGHVVDRSLVFQFPDDVHYSNECGTVDLFSKSRLGRSDLGVNSERLDQLEEYLLDYDFETTCQ